MPPDAPLPEASPPSAPQASAPSLFEPTTSVPPSSVNNHSSPEEKIAFFRALFRGREDVFARRWQSAASGKSGYSPACANEWKPGLCPKPKGSCSKCEQRKLIPLSDDILTAHLQGRDALGRDVIGLYPILPDDSCFFLALDFDDEGWQENIRLLLEICRKWELPCGVERSRSGNGAHLWFFFSEPVPCGETRRLGTALLTAAMEAGGRLKLNAYDRMFPSQDSLPKGGFGNLIALPLQGLARRQGNSLFLDSDFKPYPDQWAHLSSIRRLSGEELSLICQLHARGNILGNLVTAEETAKPWEKTPAVRLTPLDFPKKLEIIRSNMLFISMEGLSNRALNQLVRLAAFRNPAFYKAQAMRLPIYNKPRIINTAEEREGYLALPRGCEEVLTTLLKSLDIPFRTLDKRQSGRTINVRFNGVLRPEQADAAQTLLTQDTGVLSAATAFGKTVLAAYLIGQRKVNTLILVHTQALLNQWKAALESFLQIDEVLEPLPRKRGRKRDRPLIGQLGGSKNSLSGLVDIAILQSMHPGDKVRDLIKDYGMVIVDECHHVSALSFEKVMKEASARYVYGLSATPTRADGLHPIVFFQCGPIRHRVDAKEQARQRNLQQFVIPRFTTSRTAFPEKGIAALYTDLAAQGGRNQRIVQDVKEALAEGRSPILLTERREHVEQLASLLSSSCEHVISLYGTASAKLRRESMERLQAVPAEAPLVVIATGKYVGEGFDYPRLDTLFLTLPVAWKGIVAQYAGRLHRSYPGKSEVQIYDYVDIHIPVLEKMYQKRLRAYASLGYQVKPSGEVPLTRNLIYDGKIFYPVFCQDLLEAQKEILIVSPFMSRKRLQSLCAVLSESILRGVKVKAVVRPPEDLPEKDSKNAAICARLLEDYGIIPVFRPGFHQKFTIVDGKLAWYGSVNILSFGRSEESIMRLSSEEIAGALMDTVK